MSWIITNLIQLNENNAFGRHFAIILTFKKTNNKIKPKSSLPGTTRQARGINKKVQFNLKTISYEELPFIFFADSYVMIVRNTRSGRRRHLIL